jgi:hypothetical protein
VICNWFLVRNRFPQPCFCIRVVCEKKRQPVFLAFVSEFLFFSFFWQGKKKSTKTKKQDEEAEDDEEEETRRTREWF